jgi:uncharacterized repeat protein (TIGR01451 family)
MKTSFPRHRFHTVRVFTAILISYLMLVAPAAPLVSASARAESHTATVGLRPADASAPAPALDPPAAIISATKTDSFPDPDGDGKAEPGQTITYDVNVSNTGAADATGVTFNDTVDANTTLVPGSLRVSPLAFADSYNATLNTPLSVAAPGVLANDTGTPAPTAQPIAAGPTTQGGTVTLNADGSFNYTPASGFQGADTFTYTATNGLTPNDTATVTINVDAAPFVASTSPTNGASSVAQNTNITINFSEPVTATTGSFSIQCPTGSPQTFSVSGSGTATLTLHPSADLPAGQTCTVTVSANQISDVDNFDPPDHMDADYTFSFGVRPLAVDDMHSVTGNVRINTANSGYSVLANDQGAGLSITAFDSTSAHGGDVVMNTATGTFTYDPPRGFTGTDSFHYTISNAGGSATGTVVLTVSDMIWFINNAAGACSSGCDGRLTHPLTTLAAFEAENGNGTTAGGVVVDPEAGDNIFLYGLDGNYTGPLTLENNQRLIGQGATSSITAITGITLAPDSDPLPSTGGTAPVITGGGVTLAQNDSLYGLSFQDTTTTAIRNTPTAPVGTFFFDTVSVSNTSTNQSGLVLDSGGTVTSTGTNTINSGTATALNVTNTNIGAAGLTFRSITSVGDGSDGIVLDTTGAAGGLTVTGNGGTCTSSASCTGGTISNKTGADGTSQGVGIYANNTANVSITRMQLNDFSNYAVRGTNVSGFTLNNSHVSGTNGDNAGAGEGSVIFDGLTGTSFFSGDSITGSVGDNFRVKNSSGTSTVKVDGSTFSNASNDNLNTDSSGTATINISATNNTFAGAGGDHFQANTTNSATTNVVFTGNFWSNGFPGSLGGGLTISGGNTGSSEHVSFDISNNGSAASPLTGTVQGGAINVNEGTGGGVWQGQVSNNVIGDPAVAGSGASQSSDIRVENHSSGTLTAIVSNNTVRQWSNEGINFQAGDVGGNGALNATVTGNVITSPNPASAADHGIQLNVGVVTGNSNQVCFDLKNNNSTGDTANGGVDYRLRERFLTTVKLPGYTGANNSNSAVASYVLARPNTASGSGTVSVANNVSAGGGGYVNTPGGAQCAQPTVPVIAALRDVPGADDSSTAASFKAGAFAAYLDRFNVADAVQVASLGDAAKYAVGGRSKAARARFSGARLTPASYDKTANAAQPHGRTALNPKARAATTIVPHAAPNAALAAAFSGETVNASIGTLPAGKHVHITFQVTINNPFPSGTSQVSNQGTVSGDNFSPVVTDDPAVGGSSDPTVTPVLTPPDIAVKDATVAEPQTGSSPAAFAVTLSHSYTHPVTVSFATADDTLGAHPATAGSDYTSTAGTLTFNPGETVQTISVPVLADADNTETNETFLVNISGANVGTITRPQAVGTITPNGTPGTVIISELRTSGPAGPGDQFVELQNNTDADITVSAPDGSGGWALVKSGAGCGATPVVVAVIPAGTVIPARGNYLLVGSQYSLGAYAAGDQALVFDIEADRNVALFNTADLSNISTAARLDAVGFGSNTGGNCDLLREGGTLPDASGSTSEYSFVRQVNKGATQDTGDNSSDFIVVSTTTAAVGANTPTLGAPGPENSTGARGPVPCTQPPGTTGFGRARLDSTVDAATAPNIARDNTSNPGNNSTFGTVDFRRRFTNNTGAPVTRLRFRITNTLNPATAGAADLRALTSSAIIVGGVNDAATCGGSAPCSVAVQGTTLEQPPAQTSGGGVNSSLGVGTITFATPLAAGADVDVHLLFGVQQTGNYHLSIVVEDATAGTIGQDIWELRGNTQTGGDTDGGCNTPPVANAGPDQTIECGGASTSVVLDGSASSDPDGDTPLTYEWKEGATLLGTGVTLSTSLPFGSHTITLKVTDPSGDFGADTVNINIVDTTDPVITAPPNVTVSTGPGATSCGVVVTDAQLGTATASDTCSGSVAVTRSGVPSGNNFPVGQTIITYTANDGHGHTKSAFQTVTVIDNTPPVLSVPANITVNAPANSCSAMVNPGTATATDNCGSTTVTGTRSDSQPLSAPYPVGTTTITWKATDSHSNVSTGTQTITVKDVTPPTIALTTNTIILDPPNHAYHTLTISDLVASASDSCDASVNINHVVISQVTSDEVENGNGDGNTLNDIVIAPDCKSVQLRAERDGSSDGRVYTITLQVKDSSGNVATAVRKVFVPNGSSPAIDSGVHYTVNGCTP